MRIIRTCSFLAIIALFTALQACKTKKMAVQPSAEVETVKEEPAQVKQPEAPPAVEKKEEPAPVAEKPNFSFRNIQFEFDSRVLKTGSYEILDQISREIRKDPAAKFTINGHASVEGTPEHNMSLSVDRANAVKLYLVNAGIDQANLTARGFGATEPAATNDTETGRALNRRVEIKLVP